MQHFGRWTKGYFAWRGTSDKPNENDAGDRQPRPRPGKVGLTRIHTSYISAELGVAAIWARLMNHATSATPRRTRPRSTAFAPLLVREGVTSYLEVGSKFGGSLWRAANALPKGSRIVSVDLPGGTKAWKESEASLKAASPPCGLAAMTPSHLGQQHRSGRHRAGQRRLALRRHASSTPTIGGIRPIPSRTACRPTS
jgi:hypothetical protein